MLTSWCGPRCSRKWLKKPTTTTSSLRLSGGKDVPPQSTSVRCLRRSSVRRLIIVLLSFIAGPIGKLLADWGVLLPGERTGVYVTAPLTGLSPTDVALWSWRRSCVRAAQAYWSTVCFGQQSCSRLPSPCALGSADIHDISAAPGRMGPDSRTTGAAVGYCSSIPGTWGR